jgi:D-alanine-D-alanine ligase
VTTDTKQPDAVLILYNEPGAPQGAPATQWAESEAGVLREAQAVADALTELGIPFRRAGIHALADLPAALAAGGEPIVFNLVEGLPGGAGDVNAVTAVCAAFGRNCTGNTTIVRDKWLTKAALSAHGVPTPAAVVVPVGSAADPAALPAGPLIVKPVAADGSEGIGPDSVVPGPGPALAKAVRRVHRQFNQPALVEQFIDGREVNISVIEMDGAVRVLPLAEIEFRGYAPGRPRIVDYAAKWHEDSFEYRNTERRIPADLPAGVARALRRCARQAWRAAGCRDYVRVDCRVDSAGNPYVIEVNANPDIAPDAGFAAALAAAKIAMPKFVEAMITNARNRTPSLVPTIAGDGKSPRQRSAGALTKTPSSEGWAPACLPARFAAGGPQAGRPSVPGSESVGLTGRDSSKDKHPNAKGAALSADWKLETGNRQSDEGEALVRWSQPADRDAILAFTAATNFFRPGEIDIAREVLDDSLRDGPPGDYQSYSALLGGRCVGWVCFGPTPCTEGTYDLYWIVVDPACQGRGVGRALMQLSERLIAARGGRLVVVETSGRADYDSTRQFYLRIGYHQAAFIEGFYAPGDAKVVYLKAL